MAIFIPHAGAWGGIGDGMGCAAGTTAGAVSQVDGATL